MKKLTALFLAIALCVGLFGFTVSAKNTGFDTHPYSFYTNCALGADYIILKNGDSSDPSSLFLYDVAETTPYEFWGDVGLTKLTDGITAAGEDMGADGSLKGVTVIFTGTNALFEYIIDLGKVKTGIDKVVFRGVRDGVANGNDCGFSTNFTMLYISDTYGTWGGKLKTDFSSEELKDAPLIKHQKDEKIENVENFTYTFTIDSAVSGRYVRIITSSPVYRLQFDEIEVWGYSDTVNTPNYQAGSCGENVFWELDFKKGVLDISGTGSMENYDTLNNAPWSNYYEYVKTVNIAEGVDSIGEFAFYRCSSLTNVTIPNGVISVGDGAFSDCESLERIDLPDSVTSIGAFAFEDCTSLDSITIPDGVITIDSYTFGGCSSLTNVTIPNGVVSVGNGAFSDCESLERIVLPDSVTDIGACAFERCTALTSVNIPEGVTTIAFAAFHACSSLQSIVFPYSVNQIMNEAFDSCSSLTNVIVPAGVDILGDFTYINCYSLTSITIPDSVTDIGYEAFYNCSSLETVYYTGSEEEWNALSICEGNECLLSANIVFDYIFDEETSGEESSGVENSSDIEIDYVTDISDLITDNNVAEGSDIKVETDAQTNANSGKLVTDGQYRGDGVNGWDNDELSAEFIGTGKSVVYTFNFDKPTDIATVVFRNVLIKDGAGFGSLYITGNGTTAVKPLSVNSGAEKNTLRYLPVEGAPNYYNVVADVAVSGATELTLTLVTAEESCQFDEIELYTPKEDKADLLLGDVNGDSFIDSLDAALVLKHDAMIITIDDGGLYAADVNRDGLVNSLDAAKILKYDARLIIVL